LVKSSLKAAASLGLALSLTASVRPKTHVTYQLSVDSSGQSISVWMQIGFGPRSARVAMARHPIYDDRFWRYITDWNVSGIDRIALLQVDRDNVWRLITHYGNANLSYRIRLPREDPTNRAVWHTGIREDGGSINPMDTFLYLADFPNAEIDVTINVRGNVVWDLPGEQSGIVSYGGGVPVFEHRFHTDASHLLDSPLLYGDSLHYWPFVIDGIRHNVVYWPLPQATPFDSTAFVSAIERVAREAVAVFGKPPYPHYVFMIEDGAWGALEHKNSVTLGMPSKDLARDPHMYLYDLAHEYFHAWNLMRLYPEGRGALSADPPARSTGLWFSEGLTMFYAEALTRRAGYPENGRPRTDLLAEVLQSYFESPGNTRISPQLASEREVDTTGINGDYEVSIHTQGRLIGTALDLLLRDSTRGQKGLDDFMREMYARYALKRGFTTDDVQHTAADVCGCNLRRFFDDHVRNAKPIEFAAPLKTIGLKVKVDTIPAADTAGNPLPDTRIWAYPRSKDRRMRVWISDPASVWGRSGLHTGQDLIAFNGAQVDSFPDFRRAVRSIRIGSEVPVDILDAGKPRRILVSVPGYSRTRVRITEDPSATSAQVERRRVWETGR